MKSILLMVCIATSILANAQQPEKFEPNLISNGGVFGFTLSPDGKEAFWVKSNGKRDTLIIMYSSLINRVWQTPKPAPFSTQPGLWKDIDPIFSPDGKMILFQSNRPKPSRPNKDDFDIWAVNKTKNGWGPAYHLGDTINTDESESFASVAKNGSIYFMKENSNKTGSSDLYVSKKMKGEYQSPVNIGSPINTNFRESNPYISPKEDYIIYFSSDPKGLGDVDLMISFNNDGTWSEPKNLGKPINSEVGEFCPFIHQKQKRIYFSRTVQNKDGKRTEDIYWFPFNVNNYR